MSLAMCQRRCMLSGFGALLGFVLLLSGCAASPPRGIYLLGTPVGSPAAQADLTGEDRIEIAPVTIPAYLDSTDILTRRGSNELVPSRTGRWAERLSVGIRDALALDLGSRLPSAYVVDTSARNPRAWQLLVTITAFDVGADRRTTLVSTWAFLDGTHGSTLISEQGTFQVEHAARAPKDADAAIVASMAVAVGMLGERIARSVRTLDLIGPGLPR